jgi:flagella basal body P-ring formation protein FlgA
MKPLLLFLMLALASRSVRAEPTKATLRPQVSVQSGGVFTTDLVDGIPDLPRIRVTNSPPPGATFLVSRELVLGALSASGGGTVPTNWAGPGAARVSRRMRDLDETEVRNGLTAELQRLYARDRGEVEVRLTRPWRTVQIADENYEARLVDRPSQGLSPVLSLRFQLRAGEEILGEWTQPVSLRVWADVHVAAGPVRRGTALGEAELTMERRDILSLRDALPALPAEAGSWEFAESLNPGQHLSRRSLRLSSVVFRGRQIDAVVRSGLMEITTKVEALEDGVPGQTIRVRNVRSRKELRGRVEDENLVVVAL